ncbi:hypothetical protein CRENBAI_005941 [Crenichthys baileyi]|uniref:Fork-head domain-containing protein n=1 Tax=Crenichthys baileyi TaxID=28760 RepID=A0AAV9QSJ0_9TELE
MGPTMPPSKKAQSPSSGASASQGMSPPYRQGDATAAASEAEAADLSLSLSASFSKAEDEELTSLSWLHESTDLLNSFSHSGLRSVSPLQDPDSQHPRSPSSSSPSPDDVLLADAHSAYDLAAGANRKPPYSFSCLIFMAIEDAPNKRLPVKDIYGWILEHFPYFANAPTGWKNSVRHNLSLNKCFKKVDKDRSQDLLTAHRGGELEIRIAEGEVMLWLRGINRDLLELTRRTGGEQDDEPQVASKSVRESLSLAVAMALFTNRILLCAE